VSIDKLPHIFSVAVYPLLFYCIPSGVGVSLSWSLESSFLLLQFSHFVPYMFFSLFFPVILCKGIRRKFTYT